jgi:acetylornithine deacetylase/succinyl-diaminopimelate desuccinylase-like protein
MRRFSVSRSPQLLAAIAVLLLCFSLHCRPAESIEADPRDAEALQAFLHYLSIDTTNPPGNETSGAVYLQSLLTKEGIESRLLGSNPKRYSLYARLRSGSSAKALVLLHHIDVVPAVTAEWTKPPFAAVQASGYVWGRGALDIKSLGIAELMAFVELKRRGVPLKRDVIYLAVADEELGGLHGCRELLEKYPELFTGAGFVLNEGGYNETVVDRVSFWGIEVQQKLPLWIRLHAKGAPGHAASPPEDGGSIAHLISALSSILALEMPYRVTPVVQRYFSALAATKPDARGAMMRTIASSSSQAIDRSALERTLTSGYRSLLRDTVAVTRLSAGSAINSVPANASADVDIRLLPDEEAAPMLARISTAIGKHATVEVLISSPPVAESSVDTELFRVLAAAMKKSEPHSIVAPIVGGGTSDSRFFRASGIVAYGIAPFKVNYYDADTVHGNDERIRERFFTEGTRLMRAIVTDFCVAEP